MYYYFIWRITFKYKTPVTLLQTKTWKNQKQAFTVFYRIAVSTYFRKLPQKQMQQELFLANIGDLYFITGVLQNTSIWLFLRILENGKWKTSYISGSNFLSLKNEKSHHEKVSYFLGNGTF